MDVRYPGLRRAVYHRPHATVLPNKVVPVRMLPSCLIRLYTRPHATVDGGMLDRYGLDTYRHSRARTSELGHIHSRHESRLSVSVSIPLPCALALPSGGARSFTPNLLVVHTQHPRTARAPSPSPPRDNEISRSGSPRDNEISRSGSFQLAGIEFRHRARRACTCDRGRAPQSQLQVDPPTGPERGRST